MTQDIKDIYKNYADEITEKRYNSKYPIRKNYHREQYLSILNYVEKGKKVLDVGCGEGVLSILMAEKGAHVTGCDISELNIEKSQREAQNKKININFIEADAEKLPFDDNSFDIVVSSHNLEHLPSFKKGLSELKRVSQDKIIISLPTCMGLCGFSLLGGDNFWKLSKKSPLCFVYGFLRVVFNLFNDGVDESYVGNKNLPHIRRFPWVIKRELKKENLKIIRHEASSLCFPYFNFLIPLTKILNKYKNKPLLRDLGHGIIFYLKK